MSEIQIIMNRLIINLYLNKYERDENVREQICMFNIYLKIHRFLIILFVFFFLEGKSFFFRLIYLFHHYSFLSLFNHSSTRGTQCSAFPFTSPLVSLFRCSFFSCILSYFSLNVHIGNGRQSQYEKCLRKIFSFLFPLRLVRTICVQCCCEVF